MNVLKDFISSFSPKKLSFSERSQIVEIECLSLGNLLPSAETIDYNFTCFPSRDEINIEFLDSIENHCTINNINKDYNSYKLFMQNESEDDEISIQITINKKIIDNLFSIYDFKEFSKDILLNNLQYTMDIFHTLLFGRDNIVFELYDSDLMFSTNTMIFKCAFSINVESTFVRKNKINLCRDASAFYSITDYELIPNDFHFVSNCDNNPLKSRFEKIETLLSIAYISNTSFIENNILKLQISGQRNRDYSYNLDSNFPINKELYKIFEWIYTDGNPTDKSIIARNIINLHCRYTNLHEIDGKTFASIQSNYSLYLKDSVNKILN